MLAKKYKLPVADFLKRRGGNHRSGAFLLKIFPPEQNFSRFGLILSAKIYPGAYKRNKLKRLIFNWLRGHQHQLPQNDYLLIVLPKILNLSPAEIKEELKNGFPL